MNDLFLELSLDSALAESLTKLNIIEPTDIQKKTLPLAIANKDIIAKSQTGTGKTLAYLLPIFQKIDVTKREMQALILAPTHELVMQISNNISSLKEASSINVKSVSVIGETNINRQIDKLKDKPQIIVGTPGRTLELIKRKKIAAHTIKTIVIDEADNLLDKNNINTIKAIIKTTLRERQLLLFSATIKDTTIETAKAFMKDPLVIKANDLKAVNSNITHYFFTCERRDKIEILRKLVHSINPKKALVFINKSDEIEITTSKLKYHKLKADGLHGSNMKEQRKKALEAFRNEKINLLVASDIAARGLDIKDVTHVFNLDLPEDPTNYLHRVGRCGRQNNLGIAITIATEKEVSLLRKYSREFKIEMLHKDIYKGEIIDAK